MNKLSKESQEWIDSVTGTFITGDTIEAGLVVQKLIELESRQTWISVDDDYPSEPDLYQVCIEEDFIQVKQVVTILRITQRMIDREETKVGDWQRLTHFINKPKPPIKLTKE